MKKRPQKAKLILPNKEWLGLEPMGSLYTLSNPIIRWIHLFRLKMVLNCIPAGQDGTVLDLGTGNGALIPSLTEIASRVIGLDNDIDKGNLAEVKKRIDNSDHKSKAIHLVLADAHKLPFADGVFDYVVCMSVLEHLEKLEEALDEIGRVLKPGGKMVAGQFPISSAFVLGLWEKIMNFVMRRNPEWKGGIFSGHVNSFDDILLCIHRKYRVLKIRKPFFCFFLPRSFSYYVAIICKPRDDLVA